MLYFDHNATTPLHPVAREAWLEAVDRYPGNPSSPHRIGSRADAVLTQAREQLADWLGCFPLDLVWTASATESANMVLHHAAATLPAGSEVWISAIEHPCVIEAARRYFPNRHRLIPVSREGEVEIAWLQEAFKQGRPGLVAVMAANNETGVLQPWRALRDLCQAQEVPFFCDAAQWLGKMSATGLGACDFVSGCAHKFGGPKGAAFLKVPAEGPFRALLVGGPQEERRRAGTENVAAVLSMTAVLAERQKALAAGELVPRLAARRAMEVAIQERLPGVEILGAGADRLWNTVSALMPVADCRQRWVVKLDKAGFAVSTGSACASGKEEPSHVLAAMGRSADEASRALRFSAGWETTEADWQSLVEGLVEVHAAMQAV